MLYGGRGAGRSWGVARALLIEGTTKPLRVLCARELQNSITESVHKLLSDQIEALGLEDFYEVQVSRIIGKNGSGFFFEGIRNNVTKIKSYEGVDRCWVEEANKVSKASWEVLIPTIRKAKSEIIITFNPELETDYTYQRFVLEPPEDSFVVKMTWRDNPWFPEVLRQEMLDLKARDEDAYLNVWEGFCRQILDGAVFAKELRLTQEENRITRVPWVKEIPVDVFFDLGRSDNTAMWFVQKVAMQYRFLHFHQMSGFDITGPLEYCQHLPYLYGTFYLPHDAAHERVETRLSVIGTVRKTGRTAKLVPKVTKVTKLNLARMIFNQCWFDGIGCQDGLKALREYKFQLVNGQVTSLAKHDSASDGADAFQYFAVINARPKTETKVSKSLLGIFSGFGARAPQQKWMS